MAGEQIFIADKPTLDATKTQVDSVKSDTTAINTKTTDIQNKVQQILDKPSSGGGRANGIPFGAHGYNQNQSIGRTIFDITGKGVLRHLYVFGNRKTNTRVEVTVDGFKVIDAKGFYSTGYLNTNLINPDPSDTTVFSTLAPASDVGISLSNTDIGYNKLLFGGSLNTYVNSNHKDCFLFGDGIGFENSLIVTFEGSLGTYTSYYGFGELL